MPNIKPLIRRDAGISVFTLAGLNRKLNENAKFQNPILKLPPLSAQETHSAGGNGGPQIIFRLES